MVVRELVGLLKIKTDDKSMKKAQGGMSKLTKIVGVAAAAFASFKLASWLKGVAEEVALVGDTFDKMSKRTGVSAQALQRWDHAAQLSGASISEVEKSLLKLQKAQVEAGDGIATYADEFKRLGVETTNTDGSLKQTEELMLEMADAMNELPSDAERTAVAMTLMGRGGASLIPMFKEGSEGIREMMGEMDDLGVVMGEDMVGASAENIDTMRRYEMVILSVKQAIAKALLPIMTDTVAKVVEWWKVNKDWVKDNIFTALSRGMTFVVRIGKAFMQVVDAVMFLWDAIGDVGRAIVKGAALGVIAFTGLNAAIMLGPVGAIILLIALIALIVEDFVAFGEGGESVIGDLVESFDYMKVIVNEVWEAIKELWDLLTDSPKDVFNAIFGEDAFDYIKGLFSGDKAPPKPSGEPQGQPGPFADPATKPGPYSLSGTEKASLAAGRSNTSISQRNEVNIQVDGAGGSPKEVGAEVKRQMQSVFDDQYSKAAQNLVPAAT